MATCGKQLGQCSPSPCYFYVTFSASWGVFTECWGACLVWRDWQLMQQESKTIFTEFSELLLVPWIPAGANACVPWISPLWPHSSALPALCCPVGQLQGTWKNFKLCCSCFILHFMETFTTCRNINVKHMYGSICKLHCTCTYCCYPIQL